MNLCRDLNIFLIEEEEMLTNQKTNKRGFGVSEILGIGTILIIAAAVIIPGLRDIAQKIIKSTESWVESKLDSIFQINLE